LKELTVLLQPEDLKLTSKDILARAKAKGLLGEKKKKKEKTETEQNGDITAADMEDEKLLEKRVKRSPRKLRPSGSAGINFPTYTKPTGTSVVRSQIYSKPNIQRGSKSLAAMKSKPSQSRTKALSTPPSKKEIKPIMAEHVKVVKHPAPFR